MEMIVGVGSILMAKVVHFVLEAPFPILCCLRRMKSDFLNPKFGSQKSALL